MAVNYCSVFLCFCFVARWTTENRLKHVCATGLLLWLSSFRNSYYFAENFFYGIGMSGSAILVSVVLSWLVANKIAPVRAEIASK